MYNISCKQMAFNHGNCSLCFSNGQRKVTRMYIAINQSLFVLTLAQNKIHNKILKVKVEYSLPGITIGTSGDRQPVNISIK